MSEHTCEFSDGHCPACDPGFATPSAGIEPSEEAKLRAEVRRLRKVIEETALWLANRGHIIGNHTMSARLHDALRTSQAGEKP